MALPERIEHAEITQSSKNVDRKYYLRRTCRLSLRPTPRILPALATQAWRHRPSPPPRKHSRHDSIHPEKRWLGGRTQLVLHSARRHHRLLRARPPSPLSLHTIQLYKHPQSPLQSTFSASFEAAINPHSPDAPAAAPPRRPTALRPRRPRSSPQIS